MLIVGVAVTPAALLARQWAIGGAWESDPAHPQISYAPGTLARVSAADRDGIAACSPRPDVPLQPGQLGQPGLVETDPARCAVWTQTLTQPVTVPRAQGGSCDLPTAAACARAAGVPWPPKQVQTRDWRPWPWPESATWPGSTPITHDPRVLVADVDPRHAAIAAAVLALVLVLERRRRGRLGGIKVTS